MKHGSTRMVGRLFALILSPSRFFPSPHSNDTISFVHPPVGIGGFHFDEIVPKRQASWKLGLPQMTRCDWSIELGTIWICFDFAIPCLDVVRIRFEDFFPFQSILRLPLSCELSIFPIR